MPAVGTRQQKRVYEQRRSGRTFVSIAAENGFSVSHARELYGRYERFLETRQKHLLRQWTPEDVERETLAGYV